MDYSSLRCPHCWAALAEDAEGLRCTLCSTRFGVTRGIPQLLPAAVATNYSLTDRHRELNARANEIGWQSAVLEHISGGTATQKVTYAQEYIFSEARADFRFVMPTKADPTVIDIGSGWGNISCAFARTSQMVYAVDTNVDNLEFVRIRASQEGLTNVRCVQADATTLPWDHESCDVVLMVGVLEWVAWGRSDAPPHALQQRALERVFDVLRPGGCLYLAIENRYSAKYFVGAREPHARLRLISLLPYRLANAYSRLARRQDFREVTYSRRGLEKLVRNAGFRDVSFFYPIPGYQNIRYMVDLQSPDVTSFVLGRLLAHPRYAGLARLLIGLGARFPHRLQEWLWPTFAVVAVKA